MLTSTLVCTSCTENRPHSCAQLHWVTFKSTLSGLNCTELQWLWLGVISIIVNLFFVFSRKLPPNACHQPKNLQANTSILKSSDYLSHSLATTTAGVNCFVFFLAITALSPWLEPVCGVLQVARAGGRHSTCAGLCDWLAHINTLAWAVSRIPWTSALLHLVCFICVVKALWLVLRCLFYVLLSPWSSLYMSTLIGELNTQVYMCLGM